MKTKDKFALFVGTCVIAALVIGGTVGGLYWLTCQVSVGVLRWLTVALVLALPAAVVVTYRLSTTAAREHLAGFDKGLNGAERAIQSVGRGLAATASMARAARAGLPAQSNDDLLPRPGTMRILDAGRGGGEIIEL